MFQNKNTFILPLLMVVCLTISMVEASFRMSLERVHVDNKPEYLAKMRRAYRRGTYINSVNLA